MDFNLSDLHKEIQSLAGQISEKMLRPIRLKLDEEEKFPLEFVKALGQTGLLSVYIPEEYGGMAGGVTALCLVTEKIAEVCPGASTAYAVNALGAMPIMISGTEEQKRKYLPAIGSGEKLAAFGLSEPEAGSAALEMTSKAVKVGDIYVLNGAKQFITQAGQAEIYSVFVLTDPKRGARGVSGFILEKRTPGFDFGLKEKKMGLRCSETRSLIFTDCKVPAENLIGGVEGWGAITLLNTLNRSRIGIGAQSVGAAQGAFEIALNYAKVRKQFNRPIIDFQAIGHMLVEMEMMIEAARALTYKAAWYADYGQANNVEHIKDVIAKFGAMAKYFGSEIVQKVCYDAIQVLGGYGYIREYLVEKFYRDVRVFTIYEGTSEMQKNEIVEILIKEAGRYLHSPKIFSPFISRFGTIERLFHQTIFVLKEKYKKIFGQRMKHRLADVMVKLEAVKALLEKANELGDDRLQNIAERFANEVEEEILVTFDRLNSGYYAKADTAEDNLVRGWREIEN